MGLFDRLKRDQPLTQAELNERSKADGIKNRDLQVVGVLIQQGADIKAPREVLFYLYFPSKATADAVAADARTRGFEARTPGVAADDDVSGAAVPMLWPVILVSADKALFPDFLRESVDYCEDVAAANGGEYDGWEAGPDEGQMAKLKGGA